MLKIRKQFVLDEDQHPVAVMLDLDTFEQIEDALEDVGLARAIYETEDEPKVSLEEARKTFAELRKSKRV